VPVLTLTAFFRDDDAHGWSESYQISDGTSTPPLAPYITAFDVLMRKFRVPLLAGDGFYLGCRASYKLANGRISAGNLLSDLPVAGTSVIGDVPIQMNLASDAVKIRFQNITSTANSDVYLRGVWDDVIQAGQLQFGTAVGQKFKKALGNFEQALIDNRYGWFGIDPALTPRGKVTAAAQNEDGTVLFTLLVTNGVTMPIINTPYQMRFAKINNSKSILNRTFVVNRVSDTQVVTAKDVAFGEFLTPGIFTLPVKGFIQYDHFAYHRAGSRKTGRPFGAGRGRLAAQVLS